jgi:sugar/nucleoside kinase (ribokinase family)
MDIYPDPPGTKTEDAAQFFACLGGSSANIAVAITKLGGSVDLVTCVADDAIGRFALNELDKYGIGRAMSGPSGARRAIRWPLSKRGSRITNRSFIATARPIFR